MKRPSFFQGVLLALVLAIASGAGLTVLTSVLGQEAAWYALTAALALVYVVYLMNRSVERVGRLTTIACWLAITGSCVLFDVGLVLFALLQIGMLWLVRSLYFHASLVAALLDLGLGALAVGAGGWAAVETGSVFLSVWCFFLVHALFVTIPPRVGHDRPTALAAAADQPGNEPFARAQRLGEAALRQLLARSRVH